MQPRQIKILGYRRLAPRQGFVGYSYGVWIANKKGDKYRLIFVFCQRRRAHFFSSCSCPAMGYKKDCYHRALVTSEMMPVFKAEHTQQYGQDEWVQYHKVVTQ
jgi:hypothetical protein